MTIDLEKEAREFTLGLFLSGGGTEATRLVLYQDVNKPDLGGWCKGAIVDRVEAKLRSIATRAVEEKLDEAMKLIRSECPHCDEGHMGQPDDPEGDYECECCGTHLERLGALKSDKKGKP